MALILLFQGYPDQALARSREALAAAYELGHAYTTSQALYLTCWLHQVRGEPRVVQRAGHGADGAGRGARSSGWVGKRDDLARLGGGRQRRGRGRASPSCAKAWRRWKPSASAAHDPAVLGLLAELYIGIENSERGAELLDEALARVDRLEERWFEARAASAQGRGAAGGFAPNEPPKPKPATSKPWLSPATRAHVCGSCAPRPASPGCGAIRAGAPRPTTCSRRSTAGSPRASTPPI